MVVHKAQDLGAKPRTEDIQISDDIDFKSMLLPKPILKGLAASGYVKPSPVQRKALPLVRCGLDLIVQAKAGTGKTCVFAVAALELVQPALPHLQALVLAPTREIALQITDVIKALGQAINGLKVHCFIGGYPVANDRKNAEGCHIAIGAPGRVKSLLEKGILQPKHVRLFVLDEADKLMEESFVPSINEIFSSLPESKQVLALSATYMPEMVEFLKNYMHQGQYVTPQTMNHSTVLVGIRQFVSVLPQHVDCLARLRLKERHLLYLLRSVSFNQCLIFSNLHSRAVSVCNLLRKEGWSVEWIAGRQKQEDRVISLSQLKEQRVRILVTTDLIARGIDAENVNFIINLDVPRDYETYLHRMGRAGRYGTHGIVITVLSAGDEVVEFQKLIGAIGGTSQFVNCIPEDLTNVDLWSCADDKFNQLYGVVEKTEDLSESQHSQIGTKTDDKLLRDSSDELDSDSFNLSNEKHVPVVNICSCNLYMVEESDIKTVPAQSLFAVSKKDERWRDVLPIVINESQIPLNTPLVLCDSKFIRVTNVNKHEMKISEIEHSPIIILDDLVEDSSQTNFLSLDEIESELESDSIAPINLGSGCPEKIEHFLKNDSAHEIKNCRPIPFNEAEKVLTKYEKSKNQLENILMNYNSFDIVGWMAVDKAHDIVKHIVSGKLTILEFREVQCSSGRRHIEVVSTFNDDHKQEDNFQNSISTFDLSCFNLVKPFSLELIAERFKVSVNPQRTINNFGLTAQTLQVCNIPYPEKNGGLKNGRNKKNKTTSKGGSKAGIKPEANTINTNQDLHKSLFKGGSVILKESEKMFDNGGDSFNSSPNNLSGNVSKLTQKIKADFHDNNKYFLKEDRENSNNLIDCLKTKSHGVTGQYTPNCVSSAESSLTNESDTSSSEKLSKSSSNVYSSQHSQSLSSEESGPYINMIDNATRWQELHDCEESDSECSSELCVDQPHSTTKGVSKYFSDSTSSSVNSLHSSQMRRFLRPRSVHSSCKNNSSDSESDSDGISNQNSFRTASSELLSRVTNKEDVYIPPYSQYLYSHSGDTHTKECRNPKTQYLHNPASAVRNGKTSRTHPSKSEASTSKLCDQYERLNIHDPMKDTTEKRSSKTSCEHHTTNRKSVDDRQIPKRLTSNNLFYEWYTTWYMELRRRARHIEYIEYINMMSSP